VTPDRATRRGLRPGLVGNDGTLPPLNEWIRLAAVREIIGTCVGCGGILHAIEPDVRGRLGEEGQVTWYEYRCAGRCGKEYAAPNGRTFAGGGSTAWSRTTPGFMERRNALDDELRKQRAGCSPDGHPADRPHRGRGAH
jgi:hypothetical protein